MMLRKSIFQTFARKAFHPLMRLPECRDCSKDESDLGQIRFISQVSQKVNGQCTAYIDPVIPVDSFSPSSESLQLDRESHGVSMVIFLARNQRKAFSKGNIELDQSSNIPTDRLTTK
jgi:hypothetical protein